ncbi:MAG: FtsX-like permease family protein [Oligoflexales bacterium]
MRHQKMPLRIIFWIAWRNIVSKKRQSGLSFMTTISIFGILLGVAALVIVLSVMGGFEGELKEKMLKGEPHLEIVNKTALVGLSLKEHPLSEFAHYPEISHIEPFVQADVVAKQGKHLSPMVLFGIDPTKGGEVWGFGSADFEGDLKSIGEDHEAAFVENTGKYPGIALGKDLAKQLGASLGDELFVISPEANGQSVLAGGTLSRPYVVSGIFETGLFNYDAKWAVVRLDEARKFMADYDPSLDEDEYVSGIGINVQNPFEVEKFAKKLPLGELTTKSWTQTNSALLFALKLEKFTMGAILMLIVLVAAFSISGTLMMTVFHKKRQIAILRSLGATRAAILKTFLAQGLSIGLLGVASGGGIGLSFCYLLEKFKFHEMPSNIYYLRSLPVKFLPFDYLVICFLALILSLIGALYPAFIASKQNPSQGLRY